MLPLDAEKIHDLLEMDGDSQRRWLVAGQPSVVGERHYWWEAVTTIALSGLYDAAPASPDELKYALLAMRSTEGAMAQHVVARTDGLIRISYLASRYGRDAGNDIRSILDPDQLASDCLASIELPYEVVLQALDDWRSLPRSEILALRKVKKVISAVAVLIPHVSDGELRDNVLRWLEIRDLLP
ncbi:hypothetical protein ABH930_001714 [Kitasatospora sp. GAS204A]|uniref:hypothetical protein n=1 Tax=unclassified Kitasatospora TaxID=2633591 RepID=UPI0024760B8A|nr:hypothetical protein [Kitasatospora sp. GAS204B]MDH6117301.1 hypothetical protein [Kitasatospora sp. GAS204B]